ncbi:MAG: hypothetical protein P1P76_00735 [Anaerolineales bacterium]|nr:hypothetical protein [Anaerolineales bacterium]
MSRHLNRFGLRYFQDEDHYTRAAWNAWGKAFTSLGVHWLTLTASERRAIPEFFLRSVIDAGIQPIIHIVAAVGSISLREIAPILKSYADWGVRHVVIFDRPNLQSAWDQADWNRPDLIERFVDGMLPVLYVQQEVGLEPLLPPLEPGGDYWDTVFLESALSAFKRRGQVHLLEQLGLSAYAWTSGRPLDWGRGGPAAWPEAKPYRNPEGSENHIGFRIFDWYQTIMEHVTGFETRLYVLAGGHHQGIQNAGHDPVKMQTDIYDQLQSNDVPGFVRCFNFDAFPTGASTDSRWFNADASLGPMAEAVSMTRKKQFRRESSKLPKTIDHYALLPRSGTGRAIKIWDRMVDFAVAVQPTTGFSFEEARHARKVTILADEKEIPPEIQERLEDNGCEVSRIDIQTDEKLLDAITAFAKQKDQAGGRDE